MQIIINGIKNKLEEFKLLIHDTHADIIAIQENNFTPKAKTPKVHHFTSVRTDRLDKTGISSTINTHNTELQMVKIHITNTNQNHNLFLTAQSTQIKSVLSVPIKDFIHHYPRALLTTYPRSGRTFTTYPSRDVLNDIPWSLPTLNIS